MFKSDYTKEKISLVVFLCFLLYGFIQILRPFWWTLILSGIFVVLFFPLFSWLKTKTNCPRVSAFLVTMTIFFSILLPATITISLVVDQSFSVLSGLNVSDVYHNFLNSPFYQNTLLSTFENWHQTWPALESIDLLNMAKNFVGQFAGAVSQFSPKLLFGTAGFFFDFFIMMVMIYFLFLGGPELLDVFYAISPMRDSHEKRLLKEVKNTIDACVQGYLLTSLVQALLASFAFWILGVRGYAVLGTMTFFMSMVPIVGATGVWLPVSIFLFVNGEFWPGIFNTVWGGVLVSGIDNILKPLIIQGKTQIHPLLVFFSLFGGIACFGPMGILFGPVITAVFIATIKIYRDEMTHA